MTADEEKVAELTAIIRAVSERVRSRYPEGDNGSGPGIRIPIADLMPVVHARDAAQSKIAAIGSVNPRSGGLVNRIVQAVKKLIARSLQWFVRDQVTFNRETVSAVEALTEALNEHNRILVSLASQTNEQLGYLRTQLGERVQELNAQIDARARELHLESLSRVKELNAQIDARARELHVESVSRVKELNAQIDARARELQTETTIHSKGLSAQIEARARELQVEGTSRVKDLSAQIDTRARELRTAADADFAREIGPFRAVVAHVDALKAEAHALKAETKELKDIRTHWAEWRPGWEHKIGANEIQFLRSVADLQGAFQHRVTLIESNFRDIVKTQHTDYLGALDRYGTDIQRRLWDDLQKIRVEYDRMIYTELRMLRRRGVVAGAPTAASFPAQPAPAVASHFDYSRFAERFRGTEDHVRQSQEFYKPFFAGRVNVIDIGCGRGEFLEAMRDAGVSARGIELSDECVAQCREKGLEAENADMFEYLAGQPDGEFDGIMCSQVVEHLPPDRLPELVNLCAAKLRRGGTVAFETPNPECLAIFATYFFLDPTHTRPVPHPLLEFFMEEAGIGEVGVHRLSPASESMPELAGLPEDFREKFFGGLDYAIVGHKL